MTLSIRKRAHIVTKDLTYKGHVLELDERQDGATAFLLTPAGEELARLDNAAYESKDGVVYRLTGRDGEGNDAIWRMVAVCARCAAPSVIPTPKWDVPV